MFTDLSSPLEITAEAERSLTTKYGVEVGSAIENFEIKWSALESIRNPSIQAEVATGRFLDYFGNARHGDAVYQEPFWLITRSATVTRVRVLEYTAERFRAIACVTGSIDKTDTKGVTQESLPPYKIRGVYVFVKENNRWKLAAFFDTTDPKRSLRDWDYAPDWLKQAIGDLPDLVDNDCQVKHRTRLASGHRRRGQQRQSGLVAGWDTTNGRERG
jgi:hypothetical protein